jgi:very-short-patch-repair endonuclease
MAFVATQLPSWRTVMDLAGRQHGVVARWQLVAMGMTPRAIKYRIERGRLHPVFKGVYAVGRPQVTRLGRWMAAVLACGDAAALSHGSAASHYGFGDEGEEIEVSVRRDVRRTGIRVHRRSATLDVTVQRGIPVTTPTQTLIDLALRESVSQLERMVNRADNLDLIDWEGLAALVDSSSARGAAALRRVLKAQLLALTDSELERMFLPIARRAGLETPLTQQWLDGYRVDFYWPDLGLIVETDGLRYHRTPLTQARDARRDQVHLVAGRTPVRFTHAQVAYSPGEVERTLRYLARRVRTGRLSTP